ncbi:hypothetical protein E4U58_001612, partial [Claviceps cyperi]
PGCWSTNHSEQERNADKARWWKHKNQKGAPTERKFAAFLQQYEGPPENCEIDEESDELDDEDLPAWQYIQTPEFAAEV